MLTFEWRELETLCDRLTDLRQRYSAAYCSKHAGLIEALKTEIAKVRHQRARVVQHIATQIGSAAAESAPPPESVDHRPPTRHRADPQHPTSR